MFEFQNLSVKEPLFTLPPKFYINATIALIGEKISLN